MNLTTCKTNHHQKITVSHYPMQNIGHASPQAWPSVIASCTSGMCLHMLPVEMMASTLKQTLFFFFCLLHLCYGHNAQFRRQKLRKIMQAKALFCKTAAMQLCYRLISARGLCMHFSFTWPLYDCVGIFCSILSTKYCPVIPLTSTPVLVPFKD